MHILHCIAVNVPMMYIGAVTLRNAYFGRGTGPVLLTNVYCSLPKDSLFNCSIRYTSSVTNRNRNQVIGVRCQRIYY